MRSSFIYWFILLYIPFGCILYYLDLGFLRLQYYDEICTLLLLLYTLLQRSNKLCFPKEFSIFLCVVLFYFLYSIIWRGIGLNVVLYDLQQQVKPYIIFYCIWKIKPYFSLRQCKILKKVAIFSTLFLVLSFLLTGAKIESTYLFDMRGQEFATTSLSCGMLFYSMSRKKNNDKVIFAVMLGVGLLGGKSKMFAEAFVILLILFFVKEKMKLCSIKSFFICLVLLVGAIFVAWVKFDQYYVTGISDESLARPMMYKTGFLIFLDYFPFGSGFGTFATEASRVYYSSLYGKYGLWGIWGLEEGGASFVSDTFYPSIAQFGIVGLLIFISFWRKRFLEFSADSLERYKIGLFVVIVLLGDAIADSTYVSNRGVMMWIVLGLLISGSIKKVDDINNKIHLLK